MDCRKCKYFVFSHRNPYQGGAHYCEKIFEIYGQDFRAKKRKELCNNYFEQK